MMFWKKKPEPQSPSPTPTRGMSLDSPRPQPILKAASDQRGGPSIRFAGAGPRQTSPIPSHVQQPSPLWPWDKSSPESSSTASLPQITIESPIPLPANSSPAIQRIQAPRRSSRPTSPSATSFGARIPPAPLRSPVPLTTPPLPTAEHVTTPPTAYVSSLQSRAPPPPSPYRPTSERRASPLGEIRGGENLASRPPRISSLFETPCAPGRFAMGMGDRTPTGHVESDEYIPTFNIIPATPQTMGDEWPLRRRSASGSALERAFPLDDMVDIPLETSVSAPMMRSGMETIKEGMTASDSLPAIANLEFSPFDMNITLPSMESGSSISSLPYSIGEQQQQSASYSAPLLSNSQLPPQEPLPSPPFESYPSLPSLDSERSLPSSASQSSLPSSASTSSLASYSDVEEALGSMLASLSDSSMPPVNSMPRIDKVAKSPSNPGLGLGLSLPPSASITAPLSPRRKCPPPPLDLTPTTRSAAGPDMQSAPARINHRVAFYTTARAAPNSSTSGTFSNSSSHSHTEFIIPSPPRSDSGSSLSSEETQLATAKDVGGWRDSMRSSMSIGSEASDDDPYTASIVCLTKVNGGVAALCREEYLVESTHEVGLAM